MDSESNYDRMGWHLPPDSVDKMRCGKYLAIAFGCHTPKYHFRAWYAEGRGADCSRERANLYSCMRLKLARPEKRTQLLAENRAYIEQRTRVPEGHVWRERMGPPAEWPSGEFDPVGFEDSQRRT